MSRERVDDEPISRATQDSTASTLTPSSLPVSPIEDLQQPQDDLNAEQIVPLAPSNNGNNTNATSAKTTDSALAATPHKQWVWKIVLFNLFQVGNSMSGWFSNSILFPIQVRNIAKKALA